MGRGLWVMGSGIPQALPDAAAYLLVLTAPPTPPRSLQSRLPPLDAQNGLRGLSLPGFQQIPGETACC